MSSGDSEIFGKIKKLQDSVAEVCRKAGRDSSEVTVVYVTKTVSAQRVLEAAENGARCLGENKVQEFQEKSAALKDAQKRLGFQWHLIGHLQTNKVKHIVGEADLIHSLDRIELAEALEKQAAAKGIGEVNCLVQINSSGEQTKFGLAPEETEAFVAKLKSGRVKIKGLMTIGPLTEDENAVRQAFKRTKLLRDDLRKKFPAHDWDILSMGMSGDYKIAVEEGSTMIRVGTAVFGERKL